MNAALTYLLIGAVLAFLVELFWDYISEGDQNLSGELNMGFRLELILGWPILVFGVLIGLLTNNSNGDNDDDAVGPGYGT